MKANHGQRLSRLLWRPQLSAGVMELTVIHYSCVQLCLSTSTFLSDFKALPPSTQMPSSTCSLFTVYPEPTHHPILLYRCNSPAESLLKTFYWLYSSLSVRPKREPWLPSSRLYSPQLISGHCRCAQSHSHTDLSVIIPQCLELSSCTNCLNISPMFALQK